MKRKSFLSILLVFVLIVTLFTGCGASANSVVYEDTYLPEKLADSASGDTGSVTPPGQKLIRTLYLEAETNNMDSLLSQIDSKISEFGGYVESREVYNGTDYYDGTCRNADLTIRIPADKLDAFVGHVDGASNITSTRETTEDVTLNYVATQSRITALETEQARLLELMAQAASMDDLLLIEQRLTEVRTELEKVTSQLRLYDNLVDYGTIHLTVFEVVEYTKPAPTSAWERMGTGFMESLEGLGNFFVELFILLVSNLPVLILLAAVALVVVFLIKRHKKKKAPKKPEQPQE